MDRIFKNLIRLFFLSLLTLFLLPSNINAAESNEELELYQKLFEVTGSTAQYDQLVNMFISQVQQGFSQSLRTAAQKAEGASAEDKEKLKILFQQTMKSMVERLRVEIHKVMPSDELVKEVYFPIYSKHFSIEENKEIISFYESPVGSKFVQKFPVIMQEAVGVIDQKYSTKLREVGSKISLSEGEKIDKELAIIAKKK